MTNMISGGQIMKTDEVGRVRTPRSRQNELLDEFERSGVSGTKFAALVGVKYQTFATWVKRRRKERTGAQPAEPMADKPVSWLEAVVQKAEPGSADCELLIHLPGGARMKVLNKAQATLAAEFLKHLATC